MTIDEQSVRAMMPIRTLGYSGASAAYTPPNQPAGTPARTAAAADVRRMNSRRVLLDSRLLILIALLPDKQKWRLASWSRLRRHRLFTRASTMMPPQSFVAGAVPAARRPGPQHSAKSCENSLPVGPTRGRPCTLSRHLAGSADSCGSKIPIVRSFPTRVCAEEGTVTTPLAEHSDVRSAIELLAAWIESQIHYRETPGLVIGIVHDQTLVWGR